MIPSDCGGWVPVAARSASSNVDHTTSPSSLASRRSSTRPNSRSWASGLERYSRREMSDSGAPASTRAADTDRVRGVALGWAKVAVSMTIPAMSAGAIVRPVAVSKPRPRRTASRATISHVAAASGSIQSASPVASFDAW